MEVNAAGEPVPAQLAPTQPKAGYNLRTTLDLALQREGEKALRQGDGTGARVRQPGDAGAFVAMDPRNGEVLAMGSYPSFDPNRIRSSRLTPQQYDAA